MSKNKHTATAEPVANDVAARLEGMANKDGKINNDQVREQRTLEFGRWSVGRTRVLADFQVYVAGAGEPTVVENEVRIQVRVLTGPQRGQVINMAVSDIKTLDSREGSARLPGDKVTSELELVRRLADKFEGGDKKVAAPANDKSAMLVLSDGTHIVFRVQKDDSVSVIPSILSSEPLADRMQAKLNPTTLKGDEPKGDKCLSKRGWVFRLSLADAAK